MLMQQQERPAARGLEIATSRQMMSWLAEQGALASRAAEARCGSTCARPTSSTACASKAW